MKAPALKIRVLVVDDSVVMQQIVCSVLAQHPQIEVAGVAGNGKIALRHIERMPPDLVTLDIEMPEMDGLATMSEIHRLYPRIPVIMFSTLTHRGATQTIEALTRGASDYVAKPANMGNVEETIDRLRNELVPKIISFVGRGEVADAAVRKPLSSLPHRRAGPSPGLAPSRKCDVVAIASSTGGPNALQILMSALPKDVPVPILVVQHMPPIFTGLLARRLDEASRIRVFEAEDGQTLLPGHAYLAPGGKHLEARGTARGVEAHLHEGAPENSCRPAADVLFRSVAKVWGNRVLGVVLTGMGRDGTAGAKVICDKGGSILAQDRETSVVWGMPGSVIEAQLADEVLPIRDIAPAIAVRLKKERVDAVIRR